MHMYFLENCQFMGFWVGNTIPTIIILNNLKNEYF